MSAAARDEHLADGDALDRQGEDVGSHALRFIGASRELDPAGLAASADEDLGLHDDPVRAVGQHSLRRGTRLGHRPGDRPGGDGQALGEEERLGVRFLDLHAGLLLRSGRDRTTAWVGSSDGTRNRRADQGGSRYYPTGPRATPTIQPRRNPPE